ncbi:hypothetical protein K7A26_03440 [Escherichia marmotae]|uniref:hypothetical protein n=1 Tax=Escherichia marmotae TaxID=1499973 RepID=UPI001C9BA335|nr:hypothetical protein [Escherichia marmotae]MBY7377311.1 hypothetical protein [Escherichia marmotae]MBY7385685.1 hypothetical protein [Escherichia marmotae]
MRDDFCAFILTHGRPDKVLTYQMFPGAPTIANVHPDEVDNWKAMGWKTQE